MMISMMVSMMISTNFHFDHMLFYHVHHQDTLEHTLAGGADSIRDMEYKVKKLDADKKQVRAYYHPTISNQTAVQSIKL